MRQSLDPHVLLTQMGTYFISFDFPTTSKTMESQELASIYSTVPIYTTYQDTYHQIVFLSDPYDLPHFAIYDIQGNRYKKLLYFKFKWSYITKSSVLGKLDYDYFRFYGSVETILQYKYKKQFILRQQCICVYTLFRKL